jgi:hypothetical protein
MGDGFVNLSRIRLLFDLGPAIHMLPNHCVMNWYLASGLVKFSYLDYTVHSLLTLPFALHFFLFYFEYWQSLFGVTAPSWSFGKTRE